MIMKKILFFISGLFFCTGMFSQEYLDMWQDPNQKDFYAIQEKFYEYFENRDKGRGSGYKQFKRWEMFMEPRVYPSGRLINYPARMKKLYEVFKRSVTYKSGRRAMNGDWESLGPTDYTDGWGYNGGVGRLNCVEFNPYNTNAIWVGAPAGGLWYSGDAGASWNCLTTDFPTMGISDIAVQPNNANIIHILTGDGDGNHTTSIGVLKSTDGGITWSETDLSWAGTSNIYGYKLLMHPWNFDILFVVATNGIWKTTDGGDTWTQEHLGNFRDIEFRPNTPDTMYAVSKTRFYKSTNLGDSWTSMHVTDGQLPTTNFYRIALSVTPDEPDNVYLLYGGGNVGYRGLYFSDNGGNDFNLQSNTPNILGYPIAGDDSTHQANYDHALLVDPSDASTIWTGGINVWRSNDYGVTWTIVAHWKHTGNPIGYVHADIHALEHYWGSVWVASDGGIFRSSNDGDDWTDLSAGLNIMQFYHIDVLGSTMTGGTQDNGCNQWTLGSTNALHTIGADGMACIIDYTNSNIRYQSDQENKFRTTNGGSSFTNITPDGTVHNGSGFWGSDWIMHPTDPDILYMGSHYDLYRTTTAGTGTDPWTPLNVAFPDNGPYRLAQSPADVDVMYASNGVQVRRSTNVNATYPGWVNITGSTLPTSLAEVTSIAVDPTNASRVWVTMSGFEDGVKVYYTPNGTQTSATWYNESGDLPNIPVNIIVYEPGSNDGLYIGTDFGVFYKNDDLGDWVFFGNGMPAVPINDLDIDGSWLYAGTYGQGMWRTPVFSGCPVSLSLTPANVSYGTLNIGTWWHQASSSITSTVVMDSDYGTNITYRAGDYVRLDPGFEIKAKSKLSIVITPCGSNPSLPPPPDEDSPIEPVEDKSIISTTETEKQEKTD
jgi:hypothetical protein